MTLILRKIGTALLVLSVAACAGFEKPTEEAAAPPVVDEAPKISEEEAQRRAWREASIKCLAQNAYFEARGEGALGMTAVTHVVMNRVRSPKYPSNACAVIRQGGPKAPCQFSWYCDGRSDVPQDSRSWAKALTIAQETVEGKRADPTKGATMFHARRVQPFWASHATKTAEIGHHIFYQLN